MRYLKEYILETDVQTALDNGELGKPYVAYIESEDKIDWDTKTGTPDYSKIPFSIVAHSDGTIYWKTFKEDMPWEPEPVEPYIKNIYYFRNGESPVEIEPSVSGTPITVSSGDVINFGCYSNTPFFDSSNRYCYFDSTIQFSVQGNIMSLYSYDSEEGIDTLKTNFPDNTSDNYFAHLFYNCTGLTSAENLFLPYNTTTSCYDGMFSYCTSLETAPELPATTLANSCYRSMFAGCTGLTTAPELLATTLADSCYNFMFNGCSSLTTAPELPVTTLSPYCYQGMFQNCTSLTTAPELPATTLVDRCYSFMFAGCTGLVTAPELPTTTLAPYCYTFMFQNCTSLNYIKCLATDISASGCTNNWVSGVTSKGTFVKAASMRGWSTGNNGIPSGWTVQSA